MVLAVQTQHHGGFTHSSFVTFLLHEYTQVIREAYYIIIAGKFDSQFIWLTS